MCVRCISIVPHGIWPLLKSQGTFCSYKSQTQFLRKNVRSEIFLCCWKKFLATFFCCSNKKQQIFCQMKLWRVVAFCRSKKIFSLNFFTEFFLKIILVRSLKLFGACALQQFGIPVGKTLKTLFFSIFWCKFWAFGVRARQIFLARAQIWCWEKFDEKFLFLRKNATTHHNFTYQQICCFLLLQQKINAKKFSILNIEKFLIWQFFLKIVPTSSICKKTGHVF